MGAVDFTKYVTFLNGKVWDLLQQFGVFIVIVGIISCLITQSIKKSDDNVFTKGNLSALGYWIINICTNLLLSVLIIVTFDGLPSMIQSITYIVLIFICSWVISILAYDYILKYFFLLLEIIENKIQVIKADSELSLSKVNVLLENIKAEARLNDLNKGQ